MWLLDISGRYSMYVDYMFFFERYGDHRDLHVLTHSFPTRRSSDLENKGQERQDDARRQIEAANRPAPEAERDQDREDDRRHAEHMGQPVPRSEEHTSELQSLMRISYAVFCLQKKTNKIIITPYITNGNIYT